MSYETAVAQRLAPILLTPCRGGEIGIRSRLKIYRWQHHVGSSPTLGTIIRTSRLINKLLDILADLYDTLSITRSAPNPLPCRVRSVPLAIRNEPALSSHTILLASCAFLYAQPLTAARETIPYSHQMSRCRLAKHIPSSSASCNRSLPRPAKSEGRWGRITSPSRSFTSSMQGCPRCSRGDAGVCA
jgi:hypothetical protein